MKKFVIFSIYKKGSKKINDFQIPKIFKSINDIFYLIYSNKNKSLICYNLKNQKIVTELKNSHNRFISNIIHYLDENNKRDIIMSISHKDNNIKIWNAYNWECILNLQNINKKGILFSGGFLNNNNQNYILTSNLNWNDNPEVIKIFDFNGNKIKEIKDSNENTFFIESFYNYKTSKNYIIASHYNYVKSYNYNDNILYKKYYENDNGSHKTISIISNEEIIKLIESCVDGNIRVWDFHSGLLLNKINVNRCLNDICIWNNNYIFVGANKFLEKNDIEDNTIKLVDLKSREIIISLSGHNERILEIKKIIHPILGICLITQGHNVDQIRLWLIKN